MRRHIPRLAAILVLLAPVAASAFSIQLDYYGEKKPTHGAIWHRDGDPEPPPGYPPAAWWHLR